MAHFYQKYQSARDGTWKLLIDLGITELPIVLSNVCGKMGIRAYSFNAVHIGPQLVEHGTEGVATYQDGEPLILYNPVYPAARIRFTIGHEIGHLVLGHVVDNGNNIITPQGLYQRLKEPLNEEEQAANIFSSRFLAPACVLWGLGVKDASQIADLCKISRLAAEYRMNRLNLLYKREKEFLATRGRSCFLLSPLERQVYEQFRPFINAYKL